MANIITLTTDFGAGSAYVAAMKGVILSIHPGANIVDLSHAVPAQDIRQGAQACRWFPAGTVHVAVVDPGVGSDRAILYARIEGQHLIAPDNGLLSRLALHARPSTIIRLSRPEYWLPQVSHTFHGRDIMAPVAAQISLGLDAGLLGSAQDDLLRLDWREACVGDKKIEGVVESIDSFGNLITNISVDKLAGVPRGEETAVHCDEHETRGIFNAYADQPPMTLIALVGSSGNLELAIVDESAAIMLGVRVGTPVSLTW